VLGLARVIEAEMPELDCVCVDLDPDSDGNSERECDAIVTEAGRRGDSSSSSSSTTAGTEAGAWRE
jgi:phage terminase large subunit-like protein